MKLILQFKIIVINLIQKCANRTDSDDHVFVLLVKQASTKDRPLKQYLLCKEI